MGIQGLTTVNTLTENAEILNPYPVNVDNMASSYQC
jgi:hypothetical protein